MNSSDQLQFQRELDKMPPEFFEDMADLAEDRNQAGYEKLDYERKTKDEN